MSVSSKQLNALARKRNCTIERRGRVIVVASPNGETEHNSRSEAYADIWHNVKRPKAKK